MRSILLFFTACFTVTGIAQVKLPRLVRDSMVLQRDTKVKIWGWAAKGEKVSVSLIIKVIKQKRIQMANACMAATPESRRPLYHGHSWQQ
ncbi:MAG: hypothetical protein WDO16_03050 [Bacteroidota bacterium]